MNAILSGRTAGFVTVSRSEWKAGSPRCLGSRVGLSDSKRSDRSARDNFSSVAPLAEAVSRLSPTPWCSSCCATKCLQIRRHCPRREVLRSRSAVLPVASAHHLAHLGGRQRVGHLDHDNGLGSTPILTARDSCEYEACERGSRSTSSQRFRSRQPHRILRIKGRMTSWHVQVAGGDGGGGASVAPATDR